MKKKPILFWTKQWNATSVYKEVSVTSDLLWPWPLQWTPPSPPPFPLHWRPRSASPSCRPLPPSWAGPPQLWHHGCVKPVWGQRRVRFKVWQQMLGGTLKKKFINSFSPWGFLHPPWQRRASVAPTRPESSTGPGRSSAAGGPAAWRPRPPQPWWAAQSNRPTGSPEVIERALREFPPWTRPWREGVLERIPLWSLSKH